jgi:hypothetical protein
MFQANSLIFLRAREIGIRCKLQAGDLWLLYEQEGPVTTTLMYLVLAKDFLQ